MSKLKKAISIVGTTALFVDLIFVTRMFLIAYFNNYVYSMNMNAVGEADVEIMLVLILLPCGLFVIYHRLKVLFNEKKTSKWKVRINDSL